MVVSLHAGERFCGNVSARAGLVLDHEHHTGMALLDLLGAEADQPVDGAAAGAGHGDRDGFGRPDFLGTNRGRQGGKHAGRQAQKLTPGQVKHLGTFVVGDEVVGKGRHKAGPDTLSVAQASRARQVQRNPGDITTHTWLSGVGR